MSSKLTFDLTTVVQENFLGNNAVYHGFAGMPDDVGREYTEEQCELEAKRAGEMKLKIARSFYRWYDYENGVQNYDNETMQAFCRWAARMQKYGIDIAISAGWCSPGDITSSSWNETSPFTVEGDWDKSVANYAKWVSETVHYLIEVRGFTNIKYLTLFTEPQRPAGELPEGKSAFDCWLSCAKAVHEKLSQDGLRHLVKLVGPNEGSTNYPVFLQWAVKGASEYIDIFSSHNYSQLMPDSNIETDSLDSGKKYVAIATPGGRIQQKVALKPGKEYQIKGRMMFQTQNHLTSSGHVLVGAFTKGEGPFFSAGGQETTRLNLHSVKMFSTSDLAAEFEEFSANFCSMEAGECYIGVFCDIKNKSGTVLLESVSLYENGSNENLLMNSGFSENLFNSSTPEDYVTGWMQMSASVVTKEQDDYYDWYRWAKTAMELVPDGKEFWFDEYNVLGEKKLAFAKEDQFDLPIHGTRLVQAEIGLMNAGVGTSLMWTLFDQLWPGRHSNNLTFVNGDHRIGLMPIFHRTYVPHPAYYAFSLVSRYMGGGEGTKVYAASGENRVQGTLTKMPDSSLGLVVVNCKESADDIKIEFSAPLGVTLHRHLYDPVTIKPTADAKLIEIDKSLSVDAVLEDTLPAFSAAVYTTSRD